MRLEYQTRILKLLLSGLFSLLLFLPSYECVDDAAA